MTIVDKTSSVPDLATSVSAVPAESKTRAVVPESTVMPVTKTPVMVDIPSPATIDLKPKRLSEYEQWELTRQRK